MSYKHQSYIHIHQHKLSLKPKDKPFSLQRLPVIYFSFFPTLFYSFFTQWSFHKQPLIPKPNKRPFSLTMRDHYGTRTDFLSGKTSKKQQREKTLSFQKKEREKKKSISQSLQKGLNDVLEAWDSWSWCRN